MWKTTIGSLVVLMSASVVCLGNSSANSSQPDKPVVLKVLKTSSAPKDAEETSNARIRRMLASRIRVEMTDAPLSEFARRLGRVLDVPILLHCRKLEELDIGGDLPLTFSTENMQVRTMLEQLLNQHEMTWAVENGVLLLTTLEYAESRRTVKVYDVADLVTVRRGDGTYDFDFEPLIRVLTSTVKYDTWQQYGGQGLVEPYEADHLQVIVVTNTEEIHEGIARLLADLRRYLPKKPATTGKDAELKGARVVKDIVPKKTLVCPAEAAIRRELRKKVSVKLKDVTLEDFARHMAKEIGAPVRLDIRELEELDIGTDLQLSVDLSGISARAVLELVLTEHELSWQIKKDFLSLTTIEAVNNQRYTRIYDVADLLLGTDDVVFPPDEQPTVRPAPETPAESPAPRIRSATDQSFMMMPPESHLGQIGDPQPATRPQTHLPPPAFPVRKFDVEALIGVLAAAVHYDTWQQYGGEGLVEPYLNGDMRLLVICQRRGVHEGIDKLLAEFRRVRREGNGLPMPKRPPRRAQPRPTIRGEARAHKTQPSS